MPIVDIHPTSSQPTACATRCSRSAATSALVARPANDLRHDGQEMDRAGVAKSAIVQASTAYGRQFLCRRSIAAHPKRFTGVFSVDMLAADNVEKMKHWLARASPGCGCSLRAARCRDRRRGSTIRAPSGLAARRSDSTPVCMQMTPQGFRNCAG